MRPLAWLVVGAAAIAALVVFVTLAERPPTRSVFAPPPVAAVIEGPAYDDFVGADACAECHRAQYDAWSVSTHGRAGGWASSEIVIAPFDSRPIVFADGDVIPSRNAAGEYLFTVRQHERDAAVYRVDGVIGGGHMVGGGTQGFVSRFPDGTVRFLPFDFGRQQGVWFCNTGTRTNQGWEPITPNMRLADCGDWPPVRVLGAEARFSNCQECHGSQINLSYDAAAGLYETKIKSLDVNCESCHGPGAAHVTLVQSGEFGETADIGLKTFGTEAKDASLESCFQCHALKDVLVPDYFPGANLQAHYSLKAPLVGEHPFFPDGRIRTFAYQQNHLYSDCYLNGSMTCVDCHEPHGQGYRDHYGRPLESRFSDGQCLSCHASKAEDVTLHTNHAPDSPGSQCVSCHMPYLQHPELGQSIQFARSDHTIPLPRPGFDEALGVESACRTCHSELSIDELEAQTRDWYGELKPHKDIIAGLIAVDRAERPPPVEVLLHPTEDHPIAQVAAINALLERYLRPDMESVDPGVIETLRQLTSHADLDVRSSALAALHFAQGENEEIRRLLAETLDAGEHSMDVRRRWVVMLGAFADAYRSGGEFINAIVVYRKALEILPDDSSVLLNLGIAYYDAQDFASATQTLERAAALDPDQSSIWVNLGLAYEAQGLDADAESAYRRAVDANSTEALAYLNLGNLSLRRDDALSAIDFYRRAVAVDRGLGRAHFYLARSYIMTGDLSGALASARLAVEFEPDNAGAREMLRDLERATSGRP